MSLGVVGRKIVVAGSAQLVPDEGLTQNNTHTTIIPTIHLTADLHRLLWCYSSDRRVDVDISTISSPSASIEFPVHMDITNTHHHRPSDWLPTTPRAICKPPKYGLAAWQRVNDWNDYLNGLVA
jgi:hypothetical protein